MSNAGVAGAATTFAAFTGMSAANAEPDIANPTTTDRTTFFMKRPCFARQHSGEISIGAAKATSAKGEQLLPF
jgi:hypothetical protein